MNVLFSIGCPNCISLERLLDKKGIAYDKNTDKSEMKRLGIEEVPVLIVDGEQLNYHEAINWANNTNIEE